MFISIMLFLTTLLNQFAEIGTTTSETAFEGSSDKRENVPQRSGGKKGSRKRGGRSKGNNSTGPVSGSKPLADVANLAQISLSRCNITKVQ